MRQRSEVSRVFKDFDFEEDHQTVKISNQKKHVVINKEDLDI